MSFGKLFNFIREEDVDIAIVQKPWVLKGLGDKQYTLFYKRENSKIGTCIVAEKHIKLFFCGNFSSYGLSVVKLKKFGTES